MLYRLTRWACSTRPWEIIDSEAWPAPAYAHDAERRAALIALYVADGTLKPYDMERESSAWYRHFGILAEVFG